MAGERRPRILKTNGKTIRAARTLRRAMTKPEVWLWQRLRGHSGDERWRKQHPIDDYVLDFLNPAARLVVEIDGQAHDMGDRPARDLRRDAWLHDQGYRIVRLPAHDVLRDPDGAADAVMQLATDDRGSRT